MNLQNLVKGHVYKNDPSIKCKDGSYIYINDPRAMTKNYMHFIYLFHFLMYNNFC